MRNGGREGGGSKREGRITGEEENNLGLLYEVNGAEGGRIQRKMFLLRKANE